MSESRSGTIMVRGSEARRARGLEEESAGSLATITVLVHEAARFTVLLTFTLLVIETSPSRTPGDSKKLNNY